VLEVAAQIPFGETASYREMAIAAGSPGAVRAAGTAMGANPVPLLIPCHRVIRSDGTAGLYGGGEETKRWLLEFEQRAA
jgi:methylated-DNA-[protein]-cysteine S-methyltransferase